MLGDNRTRKSVSERKEAKGSKRTRDQSRNDLYRGMIKEMGKRGYDIIYIIYV